MASIKNELLATLALTFSLCAMEQKQPSKMSELPSEVVALIIKHAVPAEVNGKNYKAMALTCKQWDALSILLYKAELKAFIVEVLEELDKNLAQAFKDTPLFQNAASFMQLQKEAQIFLNKPIEEICQQCAIKISDLDFFKWLLALTISSEKAPEVIHRFKLSDILLVKGKQKLYYTYYNVINQAPSLYNTCSSLAEFRLDRRFEVMLLLIAWTFNEEALELFIKLFARETISKIDSDKFLIFLASINEDPIGPNNDTTETAEKRVSFIKKVLKLFLQYNIRPEPSPEYKEFCQYLCYIDPQEIPQLLKQLESNEDSLGTLQAAYKALKNFLMPTSYA
jgi:hypothetical protein